MLRKLLVIGFCLWTPFAVWALALGDIILDSALNEPLRAEIPVSLSSPNELKKFTAKVASAESFSRFGLDRPGFLSSLNFRVEKISDSRAVLKVTSSRPITEPFVTFLVEADWASGRLLREFTVLLDPPVFNETAIAAPVQAPQSSVVQPSVTAGRVTMPTPPPQRPAPRDAYRPVVATGETYGPIRRNENLWNISRSAQVSGVSINQMMIAIYRANPEAFMGNINLLKEGSTLRIPTAFDIQNLSRSDANSVVVSHNDSWRGGSAAGSNRVASTKPAKAESTRPSSRLELKAPKDGELGGSGDSEALGEAQELLAQERVRNDELGEEIETMRSDLAETRRLLNLKNSDLAELQQRLGEKVTTDVEADTATATTPSGEPVDSEQVVAGTDTQGSATDPVDTGSTSTGQSTAKDPTTLLDPAPVVTTPDSPVTVAQTPAAQSEGLFSKILGALGNWWVLLGLALLGFLSALYFIMRGRSSAEPQPWDAIATDDELDADLDRSLDQVGAKGAATGTDEAADVEYFEDTGTFKPIDFEPGEHSDDKPQLGAATGSYPFEDTMAGETGVKLDQADVLSEADFHMAYGLYDQAADLVSGAVAKEPERIDLQMKLVEIYFVWGNKDEFRQSAAKLNDKFGASHPGEWDKILIMGKQICPEDSMFSSAASMPSMEGAMDLQLEETGATEIDFTSAPADGDFGSGDDGAGDIIDLDLGDALFANDDDPTAAGAQNNVVDFSLAGADELEDTGRAHVEEVKEQIEQALASGDDTEEMDLDELGIDLDFGDITYVSEGTSGEFTVGEKIIAAGKAAENDGEEDFDELFAGLDEELETGVAADSDEAAADVVTEDFRSDDKLLDTSELKVEMEELLGGDFAGLSDKDETSRGIESLDEGVFDPTSDSGSFSAEIRALSDESLEIGEELAATGSSSPAADGSDDDTVLQETLVAGDGPGEMQIDEDFGVLFDEAEEDTVLQPRIEVDLDEADDFDAGTKVMEALPEEMADTSLTDDAATFHGVFDDAIADTPNKDDFSDDVFGGASEGLTQELPEMDLDIGETVEESAGDNTTVRVSTSNLALPENADLTINEAGTKLDLARAYLDMGDPEGARGILEEVMQEGSDGQKEDARHLLENMSS